MASTHVFSKREEIANSITHGIGALLSIPALILLIVFSVRFGSAWHVVSFTLFGVTMLLLYFSSTFVHALPQGKAKDLFEILDHSSIYFFISGTYTPFLFLAVKGWLGWTLFGIVWGIAVVGTVFKCFFVKRFLFLSTFLYLVMGWLIVFAWNQLVASIDSTSLVLLVTGGLLYTVGTVFYVWRGFTYHHAIWHVLVLGGSTAHFFSIMSLLP
ncbi:hemolysin III family protein [Brevibacillus humidisoli]|uniref:PAQR family membrane homeostasis protein TrhA n=1 Tax=Brevibacillus humidisoli TaxID=2895522 RepID=UPI001E33E745|nr:hemolysin III family protein [Brevibacillus humidisoli]UFJ41170.1 hemolysin III family protein [Brevibacillus humidisoli]